MGQRHQKHFRVSKVDHVRIDEFIADCQSLNANNTNTMYVYGGFLLGHIAQLEKGVAAVRELERFCDEVTQENDELRNQLNKLISSHKSVFEKMTNTLAEVKRENGDLREHLNAAINAHEALSEVRRSTVRKVLESSAKMSASEYKRDGEKRSLGAFMRQAAAKGAERGDNPTLGCGVTAKLGMRVWSRSLIDSDIVAVYRDGTIKVENDLRNIPASSRYSTRLAAEIAAGYEPTRHGSTRNKWSSHNEFC